jgi:lipoprotein-anchoring transpeptidase ErfK/SrfK
LVIRPGNPGLWQQVSELGKSVSSGCIRMINQDAINLYKRKPIGTTGVVLPEAGVVRVSV